MPIPTRGFNNGQWRSIQGPTRPSPFHDSAMRFPVEVDRFKEHQVSSTRESVQPTPLGRDGLETRLKTLESSAVSDKGRR